MIRVSLQWVAEQLQGQTVVQGADSEQQALFFAETYVEQVSIDSRQLVAGALFIAIQGEQFDGHDYAAAAVAQGAVAVVVNRRLALPEQVGQIIVADTKQALGQLAAAVRAEVAPQIVAITGSSGKTTVKEMVATILRVYLTQQAASQEKNNQQVLATAGNFNNEIGVPLTLLALTRADAYAVVELGANHAGEIAYTTSLVKPQVALINNIAPAHIEGFGSLDGVAHAKLEIFQGLQPQGIAITPYDCKYHPLFSEHLAQQEHWCFAVEPPEAVKEIAQGQTEPSELKVWASEVQLTAQGDAHFTLCTAAEEHKVKLQTPGLHNVHNAVAAAAICLAFQVPLAVIQQGLQASNEVGGRMCRFQANEHITLIDDSYNANVGSVQAAIDVLGGFSERRILVLGDLGELGENAQSYHEKLGVYARTAAIDELYTVGTLSQAASAAFAMGKEQAAKHFNQQSALVAFLHQRLSQLLTTAEPVTLLIKGSRSAQMEHVVSALLNFIEQARGKTAC